MSDGIVTAPSALLQPSAGSPGTVQVSLLRNHIKSLDGLRGIAILMVLLYHFVPFRPTHTLLGETINLTAGFGWSGVDLFFVLSGFLITGILWDAKGSPNYFKNFYARRTLRIFPLYYGMLIFCTIISPLTGIMRSAHPEGGSWWWWVYMSNFRAAFRPDPANGWLGPFWSLAVEEHFYLVWPAVIFSCGKRAAMIVSVCCIILASVARGAAIIGGFKLAGYFLTPCRMDTLAIGALVALALRSGHGGAILVRTARWLAVVCAVMLLPVVIWSHSTFLSARMQLAGFPLIACIAACVVAMAASPSGPVALRFVLESRALRTIGKYSYGMYIFHVAVASLIERIPWWPLVLRPTNQFVRLSDVINFLILTLASLAVAFASWHLYEKHFLRLKRYFEFTPPLPTRSDILPASG